jgi:hypothetical protein
LTDLATKDASDLAGLSLDELEQELATLASHLFAGTCRWLELVAEIDRRGSWADSGCGSCAEWLAWRCALLPRAAREHVRVARRLSELPLIHAAFARGELSYAKVRALTRVAEADSEEELLELARVLTAAQLGRALRAFRRVSSEEARELHEGEFVSVWWEDDGSLSIHGRLSPEDGALVVRALDAARIGLTRQADEAGRGSAEPRRMASRAEALVAIADASLAGYAPRSGGERHHVVVHADAQALAGDDAGACAVEDGPAIAAETARRLACDASVVRVSERKGKPVRVGRRTRTINRALRRALTARDRGCRFPGCDNRLFVDAHHVRHWARGGETGLDNLVLLCRRHHRLVHEGGYGVDERLRFYDPWGRRIPSVWRAAVDLTWRRLDLEPMTRDEALAMRGTGWEGDLDELRGGYRGPAQ